MLPKKEKCDRIESAEIVDLNDHTEEGSMRDASSFFAQNYPEFKTFSEQIKILKQRNVIINDEEQAKAALSTYSYYSLINGFKDLYLENETNNLYVDNTKFEDLYNAYMIDKSLSNFLFCIPLSIEAKLKTLIAYAIGENIGIKQSEYLNPCHYSQSGKHKGKIKAIKVKLRDKKNRFPPYEYYLDKYGDVPPWIAVQPLSFGDVLKEWYPPLKPSEKSIVIGFFLESNPICDTDYSIKAHLVNSLLNTIRVFRNSIAHGNRLYKLDLKLKESNSKLNKELKSINSDLEKTGLFKFFYNKNQKFKNDLYGVIVAFFILINDKVTLLNFMNGFNQFKKNVEDNYRLELFNFFELPKDIMKRLDNFLHLKFNNLNNNVNCINELNQILNQGLNQELSKNKKIRGNLKSKIYHVPGQIKYEEMAGSDNLIEFNNIQVAEENGYRAAKK